MWSLWQILEKKKVNVAADAENPVVFEADLPCILVLVPKHSPNRFFPSGAGWVINKQVLK